LASAVSLSHTEDGLQQLSQIAGRSSFGSNVLEELQSKLDTGSPLDELKSILKEINSRLAEAQTADDAQDAAHQEQCRIWLADLDARIAATKIDILRIEGLIANEKNTIARLTEEIKGSDAKIVDHKTEIQSLETAIVDLNISRAAQHELFVNRTRDTSICIEAIKEIKATEGLGALGASQSTNADVYNADFYKHADTNSFLQTLSGKVQDDTAKNLVMLASAAVATLDKGDVDSLNNLLDKLNEELKTYGEDLVKQEDIDEAAYIAELGRLQKLLADEKVELANEETHNASLRDQKRIAEANLVALEKELEAAQKKLASLEETRRQDDLKCKDLHASYEQRTADRVTESATLAKIERIILQKLDTTAAHVKAAVDDVTVAE
jgi:chromosome segregation ATPase